MYTCCSKIPRNLWKTNWFWPKRQKPAEMDGCYVGKIHEGVSGDFGSRLTLQTLQTELQRVVDFPPNLKLMVSPFLVLTRYKITEKHLGSVLHIICLFNASIRALTRL